jgi:large subunit ribosomal protein L22
MSPSAAPARPPVLTRSTARFIRVSSRKARLVADLIRDRRVEEALPILQYSPQAAARLLLKVLRAALANAEHNHQVRRLGDLRVGVIVDEGPRLKRIQPRAMGRAFRILHRTSHLTVTLAPEAAGQARPERPAARSTSPARRPAGAGRGQATRSA